MSRRLRRSLAGLNGSHRRKSDDKVIADCQLNATCDKHECMNVVGRDEQMENRLLGKVQGRGQGLSASSDLMSGFFS